MMARLLRSFLKNSGGAAAVEFALLAPMMIALLFGAIELINMLQSNQRVENTAISLADVISRDTQITDDEMEGIWSAVAPLMFPDIDVGMNLRVTSISLDSEGKAEVVWSEVCGVQNDGQCGASTYAQLDEGETVEPEDLPEVNTPNSSLIRVEAAFDYQPIIGFFHPSGAAGLTHSWTPAKFVHTAFRRSRLVDPIPRG